MQQDGTAPRLSVLLLRYQQGDAAAAADLVRAASPMFARYCVSHGDSYDEVEDILQEIWLRIHKARHTFLPGSPAEPWLYAIARHTRLDVRRRRARFRTREVQMDELPDAPAASAGSNGNLPFLQELLATLPASQREVIVMLKGSGMTLEEVARATSSTVGAVKQKAHRGYERLRRALAGDAARAST